MLTNTLTIWVAGLQRRATGRSSVDTQECSILDMAAQGRRKPPATKPKGIGARFIINSERPKLLCRVRAIAGMSTTDSLICNWFAHEDPRLLYESISRSQITCTLRQTLSHQLTYTCLLRSDAYALAMCSRASSVSSGWMRCLL